MPRDVSQLTLCEGSFESPRRVNSDVMPFFILMKILCSVGLLSIAVVCSTSSTGAVVNLGGSNTFRCNDPRGYSLAVVPDPSRKAQNSGTTPRILNIVSGGEIKAAIKIPTDSDAQGFALESTERTKAGFEITIEYGTRIYYRKRFNFTCKNGDFYLYQVKVESFDKFDPVSMNKWTRKEIKVRPNLPVEKFSIFDYL
jgi:hypothetical protein